MLPRPAGRLNTSRPVDISHSFTSPLMLPEARYWLSELKSIVETQPVCPTNPGSSRPVARSQSLIVRSSVPEASHLPSRLAAIAYRPVAWLSSVCRMPALLTFSDFDGAAASALGQTQTVCAKGCKGQTVFN